MTHSISVCIATCDRPQLLEKTLSALVLQEQKAEEIVVCDSSSSEQSQQIVDSFLHRHPDRKLKYVHSEVRALPTQRRLSVNEATGDIVLFLDDDVELDHCALGRLVDVYSQDVSKRMAGIGLVMHFHDDVQRRRKPDELRERWLGTSRSRSGTVGPGGIQVTHVGLSSDAVERVDWLWGGAMSYRRQVLHDIGQLSGLEDLYRFGIGKAEDAVLSRLAREHGELLMLTQPLAFHPPPAKATRTAYAKNGWRRGLTVTLGRAHTLRWLASSPIHVRQDWTRLTLLEIFRGCKTILKQPHRSSGWLQVAGCLYGYGVTMWRWKRVTATPYEPITLGSVIGLRPRRA